MSLSKADVGRCQRGWPWRPATRRTGHLRARRAAGRFGRRVTRNSPQLEAIRHVGNGIHLRIGHVARRLAHALDRQVHVL